MTEPIDHPSSNVTPLPSGRVDLADTEERLVGLLDTPVDADATWALVRAGIGLDRGVATLRPRRRRVGAVVLGLAAALVISGAAFAAVSQHGPSTAPVPATGLGAHHDPDSSADPGRAGAGAPSAAFTPSASGGGHTGEASSSDADGSSTTADSPEQPIQDQPGQDQQGQDQQGEDQQSPDPTPAQDQGQDQSGSGDESGSSSDDGSSQGSDGALSSSDQTDAQS